MAIGFIVTDKGIEKFNQAATTKDKQIKLVQFKAGDGGDREGEFIDSTLNDLVNPVYTKQFDDNDYYRIDETYTNKIMIAVFLDEDTGPFTINEIGFFDEDGDMICYGIPKVVENKVQGECVSYKNWIVFENSQIENLEIIVDNKNVEQLKEEFQKQITEVKSMISNLQVEIEPITNEEIDEITGTTVEIGTVVGEPLSSDDIARLLDDDPSNDPVFEEVSTGALSDKDLDEILGE